MELRVEGLPAMKNSTKFPPLTTGAMRAMSASQTYPLDTIAFSNETASKVAEARKGEIPLAAPEEAETNPVSTPREGRTSFSLNSTMESVSEVEAAADKLAEAAGLDEDERFRLGMAVREAAVNAVLHGNEYDPAKKIAVSLENTGADLVISIADQGKGLDPDSLPDPLAPAKVL